MPSMHSHEICRESECDILMGSLYHQSSHLTMVSWDGSAKRSNLVPPFLVSWPFGQLLFGARRTSWDVYSVFHFFGVDIINNIDIRYRRAGVTSTGFSVDSLLLWMQFYNYILKNTFMIHTKSQILNLTIPLFLPTENPILVKKSEVIFVGFEGFLNLFRHVLIIAGLLQEPQKLTKSLFWSIQYVTS